MVIRNILISVLFQSILSGCFVLIPFVEPDEQATCQRCRIATATGPAVRTSRQQSSKPDKFSRLLAQLNSSRDVDRAHAAFWLGEELNPAAVEALVYRLQNDTSKWVRRASAKALAKIGDSRALEPLRRAMHDRDPFVAKSAQAAYASLSRATSRAALKHTLL